MPQVKILAQDEIPCLKSFTVKRTRILVIYKCVTGDGHLPFYLTLTWDIRFPDRTLIMSHVTRYNTKILGKEVFECTTINII